MTRMMGYCIIVLQGLLGIVTQLILLQELPQIFYGNELTLGIILTSWLFWAALGSGLIGRISFVLEHPRRMYFYTNFFALISFIGLFITIRYIRTLLNIMPGEIISFPLIVSISFCVTAIPAMVQGFLFTLGSRLTRSQSFRARTINHVYFLEAVGAFIGGLIFYFFALPLASSYQTVFITCCLRLMICIPLILFSHVSKKWIPLTLFLFAALATLLANQEFETALVKASFSPLKAISKETSPYGTIVVTKQAENSYTFFQNGLPLFTTDDVRTHEERTQFAMLAHPKPESVLLIGGGTLPALEALLQHPNVKKLVYVELDPTLVRTQLKLTRQLSEILNDPRVQTIYGDARQFIQKTSQTFDVIISNIPEPYTLGLNRFYTYEFFTEVKKTLKDKGIFSFSVVSSENYINNDLALLLASLHKTASRVFTHTLILPGSTALFLNADKPLDSLTGARLMQRIKNRNLALEYVNAFLLPIRFTPDRIAYVKERVDNTKYAPANFDFAPISYYYDMTLWTHINSRSLTHIFHVLFTVPVWAYYVFALSVFALIFFIFKHPTSRFISTIATIGMSEISLEIIIILLFQSMLGYVYSTTSMLIGAYMGGLALGALLGNRLLHKKTNHTLSAILSCQFAMVCLPLIILGAALWMQQASVFYHLKALILFLLVGCIGCIGGTQFPLINSWYLSHTSSHTTKGGIIYAIDLCGSACGALVMSACIIPLLGISQTLVFISFINGLCLLLLVTKRKE